MGRRQRAALAPHEGLGARPAPLQPSCPCSWAGQGVLGLGGMFDPTLGHLAILPGVCRQLLVSPGSGICSPEAAVVPSSQAWGLHERNWVSCSALGKFNPPVKWIKHFKLVFIAGRVCLPLGQNRLQGAGQVPKCRVGAGVWVTFGALGW